MTASLGRWVRRALDLPEPPPGHDRDQLEQWNERQERLREGMRRARRRTEGGKQ